MGGSIISLFTVNIDEYVFLVSSPLNCHTSLNLKELGLKIAGEIIRLVENFSLNIKFFEKN